jgi:hypothetical protein
MYDTGSGAFTTMDVAPGAVGGGGALAYDGLRYMYAFQGGGANALWRYDTRSTPSNDWVVLINQFNVNAGGALTFVPASTYVTSATVASSVLDTGRAGSSWDALIWDETLPSSAADITFEVRASDTLFAKDADNATLAWIPVGGTAPIPWELPAGQYKQWRATLTTADTSVTPLLSEVQVYHF